MSFGNHNNALESLLRIEDTLCVLSFSEIFIEEDRYIKWSERIILSNLDTPEVMSIYLLTEPVNYHELRLFLKKVPHSFKLHTPEGRNAVKLYCLGLLNIVVKHPECSRSTLQELSELYDRNTGISEILYFNLLNKHLSGLNEEGFHGFPINYQKCIQLFYQTCKVMVSESYLDFRMEPDGLITLIVNLASAE